MELLKHIEGDRMRPNRIKHIYDNWMRKIGSMKRWPVEVWAVEILTCLKGNIAYSTMIYPFSPIVGKII